MSTRPKAKAKAKRKAKIPQRTTKKSLSIDVEVPDYSEEAVRRKIQAEMERHIDDSIEDFFSNGEFDETMSLLIDKAIKKSENHLLSQVEQEIIGSSRKIAEKLVKNMMDSLSDNYLM